MRRLYLRIYLAFLATLIIFAMLAGMTFGVFRLLDDRPRRPWPDTGAEIAERLLPRDLDPAALNAELAFWSERTEYALVLLSAENVIVAQAGSIPDRVLSDLTADQARRRTWRGRGGFYRLVLRDGRQLIAIPSGEYWNPLRFLRFPAAFIGIALAIGIGFYPLIRHLTQRLENLEAGVARFGGGDLSARVDIKGGDEIARLAGTFNASADRIEALMKAHKHLLAHASHELRSPLSRLRMAVHTLSDDSQAAKNEVIRNIAELDALVDEILLASRLQAKVEFDREDVDLVGLIAEEGANYHADVSVGELPPVISGNPRLLRRLIRNLLHNASSHGGPAPPEVYVKVSGGEAVMLVCDRGPGVRVEDRDRIFEPFYRGQRQTGTDGVGLGLTLVRQIAEQNGGSVRWLPRDAGGSCFEVRLPLTSNSEAAAPL